MARREREDQKNLSAGGDLRRKKPNTVIFQGADDLHVDIKKALIDSSRSRKDTIPIREYNPLSCFGHRQLSI